MFVSTSLLLILRFLIETADAKQIVFTSNGPVRGKLNNDSGVRYYSYEGIPYAESPVGELRFRAPVPKSPWKNVLNATRLGPVCLQPEGRYNKSSMSENCLILNIYVPANTTKKLPVVLFLHGGGYKMLSGNPDLIYGPQYFLQRDVLYVSLNYRLGALGFLSLKTERAPGNAGLKDVLLALKWIRTNIKNFGGNKNKITVGGSSSGSSITHYLLLTEKSAGLFERVFLISGSAVSFRFVAEKPKKNALALANQLGLQTENITTLTTELKKIDPFDIIDAQESIYKYSRNEMRPFGPFVPSVENESPDAIITRHPFEIIKSGMPQKVPIFAGINSLEGIIRWNAIRENETLLANLRNKFPDCIPPDIKYPKDSKEYQNLVDSISKFYFGDLQLSNFTRHNFLKLLSDTQYTFNVDWWINVYKQRNDSNILYYYLFKFEGELNWAKLNYNLKDIKGTAHSDDLGYLFVTKVTRPLLNNLDDRTKRMRNVWLSLLTNFIKFGNPTPANTDIEWPKYDERGSHLILTDHPLSVNTKVNAERFNFWYNAYNEYYKYLETGGKKGTNYLF